MARTPPDTPRRPLTERQMAFVREYLVDLTPAKAARRAGYRGKQYADSARDLMQNPKIREAIDQAVAERAERTLKSADEVLNHWASVVDADPNDLIEWRVGACRYCYGEEHHYQWRDHVEFAESCAKARHAKKPEPTDEGGYGYRHNDDPSEDCPRCCGDGIGYEYVHPSRDIPARSQVLYAGVERTKDGLKIKMVDREVAWGNLAKHLGMFADRVEHTGKNGGPIEIKSSGGVSGLLAAARAAKNADPSPS